MTKTLTEQLREGTLDFGYYYVKLPNERPQIYHSGYLTSFTAVKDAGRIEIIAPVPSYEQFIGLMDDSKELDKAYDKINLLGKKLAIATKALEEYAETETYDWIDSQVVAIQALKEMEGVK